MPFSRMLKGLQAELKTKQEISSQSIIPKRLVTIVLLASSKNIILIERQQPYKSI